MSNELAIPSSVNWLIHTCVTPGCQVTIRVPITEQYKHGVCKWCRDGKDYNTRDPSATLPSIGPYLSREEFGQDLFDAIKAQAGSIQAFKTSALYAAKGLTLRADEAAQAGLACQHQLERIFKRNTIAVEDVRRILAMK